MTALSTKNRGSSAQGRVVKREEGGEKKIPLDVVTYCPLQWEGYLAGFSVTEEGTAHILQR